MNCGRAFFIISSLISCSAFAQSRITDSLEQKLEKAHGTAKVDILNQLTYEFITHDNDKVIKYNGDALRLSKEINYLKGEAKAYTYRGVNEYLTAQFPEAHKDLHRGLKLAIKAGDITLQGYTLLQLGNCSLEDVHMDSALLYFKRSYEIIKDSTDPVTLSKLYRNISALYGQHHQVDSQRIYLERAIAIRRLLPNKALLAEALLLKANTRLRLGDFPGADALVKEVEGIVNVNLENEENRNDINHLKALILFHQGKFDDASTLLDSARNYYFRTSLLRKYVTLLIDLGKVFSDRGEYELALNNLYDALKLSQLRGFEVETSIIRNQIGWINYNLGDVTQALRLADEAMSLGSQRLLPGDLANALTLKGVGLTDLKDFGQARFLLDSAFHIYKRLGDDRGLSETLMNLGYLEGNRGNYNEALQLYRESAQHAESIPFRYGLAWSSWGMGDIYFKLGDFEKSAHFLDQSESYAHAIDSKEILVLNFNTRRDLLAAQHRFEEALVFSRRSSRLRDSIHRADVARRFLNLEKIQEIEQRDRDIEVLQKDKLLAQDKIHLQEARLKQLSIMIIGGIIGLILLAVIAFVYYRFYSRIKSLNVAITERNNRIQTQANKLQEVNSELERLYGEVSEQKEKIQAQAEELTTTNRNISDINRSLEKLVEQKTHELRTTNEELMKYNNELLQFSYTVSHNLRGPVVRLMGLSDLALAENDLTLARQWIGLIGKTTHELDTIIKDLSKILDLRNKPHQYHEPVGLQAEWNQARSLLQGNLTGSEEIVSNFESLPELTTVRALLQSIFYNLLSNAIKFQSPERNLKVIATSRVEYGKAILEITDNGLGFNTQRNKEKLFKLYNRFHTHVEGRGLGLYLIKSQIEVLHGSIEVESEPGRGSMFRVVLPISVEETEYRQLA
ncbi:MAG TPA: tetratricopeptide repeat protein [Cyclobacteriaceae bacterium]|nr:tetratricopeptide repeat protein [Cyclobacteriaceae bacterium]